jgi:hypothetical protein
MKEKGLLLVEQADCYLFTIIIKKNLKNYYVKSTDSVDLT